MEENQEEIAQEKKKFSIKDFYDKQYKKLLIIPILLLLFAFIQIGIQTAVTGDFMHKGVSLKGGLTIIIEKSTNIAEVQDFLNSKFPEADISVRSVSRAGKQIGTIIEASDINADSITPLLEESLKITKDQYSVGVMGSSLGASFFKETFRALYIAFLFMGMVVFLYFGKGYKFKIISVILTLAAALFLLSSNLQLFKKADA